MREYGREKKVKGISWKRDYHIHYKNRKVGNWWEGICDPISRKAMKQKIQKEINYHLLSPQSKNNKIERYGNKRKNNSRKSLRICNKGPH